MKTSFSYEILINDDASTDKTKDIIKKFHKQHPQLIKPIFQEINQKSIYKSGMNPRFNFPRAKGKYIAICDGDDYWTDPLKLQKQFDFMEENKDVCICGHETIMVFKNKEKKNVSDHFSIPKKRLLNG